MRDPESLAKKKNLSTVCNVVEIFSKALKETNVRDPASLAKEKNRFKSAGVTCKSFLVYLENVVYIQCWTLKINLNI